MLQICLWILIVYIGLGLIAEILLVGKPRRTTTPGVAAVNTIIGVAIIALLAITVLAL